MLFDVARGMARRVPLTKLVELDGDVRPYLASLMVSALHRAGDKLIIPRDMEVQRLTREQFDNMLAHEAGRTYNNYGTIAGEMAGIGATGEQAEWAQRDRMEKQLETIAKAMAHLTKDDEDFDATSQRGGVGYKGSMDVTAVLQTEHGGRIAAAVVSLAHQVEDNVAKTFAATVASPKRQASVQGALQIKQVRRASGKNHAAKSVAPALTTANCQPHVEVTVTPPGDKPSKWEDAAAPSTSAATKGHVMVDTGAAVSVVTKAWAEAHGLKVSASQGVSIRTADGSEVPVAGTTSLTLQLTPTLEVDVTNVTVSSCSFYQALLGCDVLYGKPGILGPATLTMGAPGQEGAIQWQQLKAGCIAVAPFVTGTPTVNATGGEYLPPPPPKSTAAPAPVTLASEGVKLAADHMASLVKLAAERDEQRRVGSATTEEWRDLLDRAQYVFRTCALPQSTARLLRQAFAVRSVRGATTETVLARVLAKAQSKGYEAAVQELESMGIPSSAPRPSAWKQK